MRCNSEIAIRALRHVWAPRQLLLPADISQLIAIYVFVSVDGGILLKKNYKYY